MAVGACAPAATATEPPAPAATEAPTTVAATAAPACAPAQANWDPTTADKGSKGITIAYEQEPDVAVGNFSNMSFSGWLYQMYGLGVGRWDDKNNLVAYAATDIPSADNGGVAADGSVTWKLKPCMFWSDGQPITSKDIAFTWSVYTDKGNAPVSRSDWDHVTGIDTPDDQTAVMHFKNGVYPAWPILLTIGPNNSSGSILPAHVFQGKTGLEKDPQVHTPTWAGGPFAIKEWVAGDHMTLVRNPNFFGTPAKLDYVDIKFVPDPETGLAALKTGDVDLMVNLAESDIATVQGLASNGIHLRVDPTPEFEHLFFNLGTTAGANGTGQSDVNGFCPFKDVNVRKAIMLGTDRLSFIKNYLKEDEKSYIATLWPNSYWNNTSLTPYPFDQAQAASLLDAAGYKVGAGGIRAGTCDGKPVKFSLGIETTTAQRRIDDVLSIQADLKKIGIDIKPNHIPAGTFFGSYTEGADMPLGKFDMAIFTTGYYPDPDAAGNWDCADVPNKGQPAGANNYHICDPKLDDLWKQGLASADPATRKKVYDQIQQYMYDNVLMIPLYARANVFAYVDRLVFPPSSGYSNFAWDMENFDVK
jgi:peptide/nickel transport system substrate-binding protein